MDTLNELAAALGDDPPAGLDQRLRRFVAAPEPGRGKPLDLVQDSPLGAPEIFRLRREKQRIGGKQNLRGIQRVFHCRCRSFAVCHTVTPFFGFAERAQTGRGRPVLH